MNARTRKTIRYRRRSRRHLLHFILPMLCLILALAAAASYILDSSGSGFDMLSHVSSLISGSAEEELSRYAASHGYDISDYPQSLIDLYDRNRETRDFVFEYPEKKSETPDI